MNFAIYFIMFISFGSRRSRASHRAWCLDCSIGSLHWRWEDTGTSKPPEQWCTPRTSSSLHISETLQVVVINCVTGLVGEVSVRAGAVRLHRAVVLTLGLLRGGGGQQARNQQHEDQQQLARHLGHNGLSQR